jgi:NitT/TauT family transport system substrate-binding protein
MLMAGEIDAALGPSFWSPTNLHERGVPTDDITVLLMSRYGVELYGRAIFASTKRLATKAGADAVKGFLRAFVQALNDAVKDPARATAAVMRYDSRLNHALEQEHLSVAIRDCIVTPEVRAEGLGGIVADRFEIAVTQLVVGKPFKTKPKLADIFDPSLLPPDDQRRLG